MKRLHVDLQNLLKHKTKNEKNETNKTIPSYISYIIGSTTKIKDKEYWIPKQLNIVEYRHIRHNMTIVHPLKWNIYH